MEGGKVKLSEKVVDAKLLKLADFSAGTVAAGFNVLKQFALNSQTYSGMNTTEKSNAIIAFNGLYLSTTLSMELGGKSYKSDF